MQPQTLTQPINVPAPSAKSSQLIASSWLADLNAYLNSLRLSRRSRTLAAQHINVFAAWHTRIFGDFHPQDLTNYALGRYRQHSLEEARVLASTWNSRHWALTILCNWIAKPELMYGIHQKDGQPSEIHRSLTDQEYHRLHQVLEQKIQRSITPYEHRDRTRDRLAVILMLECGLRVDELSQLDKSDLTLGERTGSLIVRNGKGAKERTVPVNFIANAAAKEWMGMRQDENPALLDGKNTARLSPRSIQRLLTDLRPASRIPDLMCHSLRYTFAKRAEQRMIKQGKGRSEIIRTVQRLLGHKRADTTEIYLRSSADDLLSAVEG